MSPDTHTSLPARFKRARAVILCFLLAATSTTSWADDLLTVRMKGSAEGVGLAARKMAVENAQALVMEEVLQAMTNSSDMTLFKPVLGQASRYIQRYDLLRSDIVGTVTEVEIDAHVLEKPLKRDVAAIMLPRLPRKPVVRLLLAEYIGPEAQAGGPTFDIAEAVFRKPMEDFGFSVKGVHDLLDHYEIGQLVGITQGDVPTTAAFARANAEDVVVVGSITTTHESLTRESNMLRNRARAVMRVVSGPDGKIRDTLTAEAAVQSVEPVEGGIQAAQDACGKLTGDCVVAIVLAMLGMEDETRVIVRVENPGNQETLDALVQALGGVDTVGTVEPLFFSETLARLAVDYYGDMAFFSDAITGLAAGGRRVEVARCVRREITLVLK